MSMERMTGLARPAAELRPEYDAVVIGSGYGGGVAASRLSRMGLRVAVLERGREFLPGDFPTTLLGSQREFQASFGARRIGSPTALFDLHAGPDVHAVVGCGLGGTSLINANVCLSPEGTVFEDTRWPSALRADHFLNVGYHRARLMLAPETLPETSHPLKFDALQRAAKAFGREAERVPLHIAFADKISSGGVRQRACTECGDCMGGCNIGAKTTVHSTYLADAANHGAELFTEARVRFLDRTADKRWRVSFLDASPDRRTVPIRSVTARIVVVAAGTLGSNEILMRSRGRGLAVSERLGLGISTNADAIAFGYNNDSPVNAVGVGYSAQAKAKVPPPGPAVSGLIDLRRRRNPNERIALVEASVQSAMARILPLMLPAGALMGHDTDMGLADFLAEAGRTGESLLKGPYAGAVHNTQIFLAVGQDSASGEIHMDGDHVTIRWPNALREPIFANIARTFEIAIAATGGTYVPNPVSHRFLGGNLLTVHPLGGCGMGDDRASGVIDHKCRVFDADPAKPANAVHDGLYVCDGSVMPRSLGVHPLLTITAVAERAMLLFARDAGLDLDATAMRPGKIRDFGPVAPKPAKGFAARLRSSPSGVGTP
jgi:cholesterol oxidase